jgi:hypothetical protein
MPVPSGSKLIAGRAVSHTSDGRLDEMRAALDINIPNYASATVTSAEVVDSISASGNQTETLINLPTATK